MSGLQKLFVSAVFIALCFVAYFRFYPSKQHPVADPVVRINQLIAPFFNVDIQATDNPMGIQSMSPREYFEIFRLTTTPERFATIHTTMLHPPQWPPNRRDAPVFRQRPEGNSRIVVRDPPDWWNQENLQKLPGLTVYVMGSDVLNISFDEPAGCIYLRRGGPRNALGQMVN
jgi:hypothetical protein